MIDLDELLEITKRIMILRGGPTSGNWGHQGRTGKKGGSRSGGGFKAIGVRHRGGKKLKRKDVKRKAGGAKDTLKKDTDLMIKKLGPDFFKNTKPDQFYSMLDHTRKTSNIAAQIPGVSTKKMTLSQAQALTSHYEKTHGVVNRGAQAKSDKIKKPAVTPPSKAVVGDVKNAREVDNAKMTSDYEDWVNNMTSTENEAVEFYTDNGYGEMNDHLRGIDQGSDRAIRLSDSLDSVLRETPLAQDTIVHRGTPLSVYSNNLGNDPSKWVGAVFEDPGFLSTSIDESKAFSGIPSQISVPKGQKAGYVDGHPDNQNSGEEELLFPKNSRQRILDVEMDENGVVTNLVTEMLPNF